MDDATYMVTFACVVEAQGFAAAAERLGLSHSVTSKHVDKLERSLGARLLNRSTRKWSLTEAGARLYPHCARLARSLQAAELAVAETSTRLQGTLRISAPRPWWRNTSSPSWPNSERGIPASPWNSIWATMSSTSPGLISTWPFA